MAESILSGVPETALWTLRNRAEEALRPGSYFQDPEAVRLYRMLRSEGEDLDRFGRLSQSHPLRALAFDAAIQDFRAEHPQAPVVALGEGLQTSYWRLGRPPAPWYSIDLPEIVAAQRRLLPDEPGIVRIERSALDHSWLDEIPEGPAMITAEGLFMYLPEDEVHALIAAMAARFPGGRLIYDSIPLWFSKLTMKGKIRLTDRYVAPPMPTHQSVSRGARLAGHIPGVAQSEEVMVEHGHGLWASPAMRVVSGLPVVQDHRPNITLLTFAGGPQPRSHTQGTPVWMSTRDGRSLYATTLSQDDPGNQPTVVFEAGAAASRSSWAAVQPRVAGFAQAVAYDRSGLGRSAPDPTARTLSRMADDLNDLLDGLSAERGPDQASAKRYVLVGHSAGGPIVRLAAARRPERIAGLVLVDPTDEAADVLFTAQFRRLEKVSLTAGGLLARAGLLRYLYPKIIAAAPPDVRQDLLVEGFTAQVMATARRQASTFLDELATWRTHPPELGDIPVTVISGALPGDGINASARAIMNASHAYRAAQSVAGRHVLAGNSSHYVPLTDPELIAEEVCRLLAP